MTCLRAMADGPQWDDRRLLDSSAILAVVVHLIQAFPATSKLVGVDQLHARTHLAHPAFAVPGLPVPTLPSSEEGCRRCRPLQGGYAFRWKHLAWWDAYQATRRTGSLAFGNVPGTPTGCYGLLVQAVHFGRDLADRPVPRSLPSRDQLQQMDGENREAFEAMSLEAYNALDEDMSSTDSEEMSWLIGHS